MDIQTHCGSFVVIDDVLEKKWWTVNLKYSILFEFKVSFLPLHLLMCTFPLAINKERGTAAFLSRRLLLSIKLCPEVITVSGIHCILKNSNMEGTQRTMNIAEQQKFTKENAVQESN
jgi:hypothetical protein